MVKSSPLPLVLLLAAACGLAADVQAAPQTIVLAAGGRSDYAIVSSEPSAPEKFAEEELVRYVRAITGAALPVGSGQPGQPRIMFESLKPGAGNDDEYHLAIRDRDLVITGSGRGRLYAVYDVLERLGCRWLAPEFAFYSGAAEVVPKSDQLSLTLDGTVVEKPDFKIRKLDVEEGLSHNTGNLKQLVAWAPKLRYNTLMVPRDYGGRGRVTWDQWRDAITPEAKKRGLIIEVGGHGYENFLNAEMSGGKLFAEHPEWFGLDESGKRSKAKRRVFCTSNAQAVAFVTDGVLDYLGKHPEIDVFELWPPDGADWCACDACKALGEPQDRQALLVNHVQQVLAKQKPEVRLEIIAYSKALMPPGKVKLDERILVDYCPINQSFESPINDPANERNAGYVAAVTAWRKQFVGDIGLYSYYRKYAWKSLPALIPHYMQADLRYYRELPLQATMIYAEPGDWATYELNHIALGRLSWDADVNMDDITRAYCAARFGPQHAEQTAAALVLLGDTVRTYGSLPFTKLKPRDQIAAAAAKLKQTAAGLPTDTPAFQRLHLMFDYAMRDLALQELKASGAPEETIRKEVTALVAFLDQHKSDGVFILTGRNDLDRFFKRYGLKAKSIEPGD